MPELIDIVPKDIYVNLSLSLKEIDNIISALDICEGTPKNEPQRIAWNYLVNSFYPFIKTIQSKMQKNEP